MRIIREAQQSKGIGIVGKIKVGEKHKEKGYPTSLDYFRVDSENKEYERLFKEAYGEKPTSLQIIFLSDNIDHVCSEFLELRDKSGKVYARGDGKNFEVVVGDSYQKFSEAELIEKTGSVEKPGSVEKAMENMAKKCASPNGWKSRLVLRFVLPKIKGLIGEWQFSTHAEASTIPQIVAVFDSILQLAGTVRMIPFDLNVKKVKSDKSGSSRNYPVVQLIPNISTENALLLKDYVEQGIVSLRTGLLTDDKFLKISQSQQLSLPEPEINDGYTTFEQFEENE
jgi:hypothetical protein